MPIPPPAVDAAPTLVVGADAGHCCGLELTKETQRPNDDAGASPWPDRSEQLTSAAAILAAEPGDVARAVHPVPSASFGTRRWLC
jgi:hypothetical protein